jgi:hypothetical protein
VFFESLQTLYESLDEYLNKPYLRTPEDQIPSTRLVNSMLQNVNCMYCCYPWQSRMLSECMGSTIRHSGTQSNAYSLAVRPPTDIWLIEKICVTHNLCMAPN